MNQLLLFLINHGWAARLLPPRSLTGCIDDATKCIAAAAAVAAADASTCSSRLGCQVVATKELDGLRVKIPSATRNFYVSEEQQQEQK
jgi:hypothetical protein